MGGKTMQQWTEFLKKQLGSKYVPAEQEHIINKNQMQLEFGECEDGQEKETKN